MNRHPARWLALAALLVSAAGTAACGDVEVDNSSCQSDLDCKGNRVCIANQCIDPSTMDGFDGTTDVPTETGGPDGGADADGGQPDILADTLTGDGDGDAASMDGDLPPGEGIGPDSDVPPTDAQPDAPTPTTNLFMGTSGTASGSAVSSSYTLRASSIGRLQSQQELQSPAYRIRGGFMHVIP